jgi:hypothetical protein
MAPAAGNIFSLNDYAYVNNKPVVGIDPDGTQVTGVPAGPIPEALAPEVPPPPPPLTPTIPPPEGVIPTELAPTTVTVLAKYFRTGRWVNVCWR